MSVKKMIKLANFLDTKYNLESSANTYDWSDTVAATREGEQFGKNVEIPLPKPSLSPMKSSSPKSPVTQQKASPQLLEGLNKIKKIKNELPSLRQAVDAKLYGKVDALSQRVNAIIAKYKSSKTLTDQDLNSLSGLHKEVMSMKDSILTEALKSFKTV